MKILFLPNWKVHRLEQDSDAVQAPDKQVIGQPYWFFRYFPNECQVDVIDFQENNPLRFLEKKANTYIWQGVKGFLGGGDYDVVISHGAQSGLMYSLLRSISFRRKPLHIIFDIGSMNGGRNNKVENLVISSALRSNPYIICHSKVVIENYKTTYKNLVDRSCYIPFGVDVEDFSASGEVDNEGYVLSFGAAKRDYQTLLGAWSGLDTDCKLRIIGHKGEVSLPNVETVERVSIGELKEQIRKALFVVIPLPVFNYSYGQMSFLQSMSMGKTVIVTRTPSSIDYLQDGRGSFFVKPYDVEDMRAKLGCLLNDRELLRKSNGEARRFVVDNFSEKTMAEKVYAFVSAAQAAERAAHLTGQREKTECERS